MRLHAVLLALAAAVPSEAVAQTWRVTPGVTLNGTWSDNYRLQDDSLEKKGWIGSVAPSMSLEHRGALLRVSADYRHHHEFYSGAGGNGSSNFLRSIASYELLEKRVWLEGRANITQERRSAFDAAVMIPEGAAFNANRAETRTFSLSPVARGPLGDSAEYQARVNATLLRSEGVAEIDTAEFLGTVRSRAPSARVGWSADITGLRSRSSSFGTLDDRRVRVALIFAPLAHMHVSLIQGYEESDFAPEAHGQSTPGLGLEWSPNSRTQFAGVAQRRFFGTGHLATFQHRTARTVWDIRSRRDSTVLSSLIGAGATIETLLSDLLTSSIPSPSARAEAVRRRLMEFGAAPTTIGAGFLTERPFLVRGVDATVAVIGARDTFTLGLQSRTQTALLDAPGITDSFAQSESVRQRGLTAAWTHRMTPLTSVTVATARMRTHGDNGAPTARQELDTVFLTTLLGPHTSASVGVRRADFERSSSTSYQERAIFGSLSFKL